MGDPKVISIVIKPTVRPTPKVVHPSIVKKWARETGHPDVDRLDLAGITVPRVRVDQRKLYYVTRRNPSVPGGVEFCYERGPLQLTTYHEIFMSSSLSECERKIWVTHELEHVRDNERLAGKFMDRLQADPTLKSIFIKKQWFSKNDFGIIQLSIESTCFQIFRTLTAEAVKHRDTAAEYQRVWKKIRETCG